MFRSRTTALYARPMRVHARTLDLLGESSDEMIAQAKEFVAVTMAEEMDVPVDEVFVTAEQIPISASGDDEKGAGPSSWITRIRGEVLTSKPR